MTAANYENCLEITLKWEGGKVDHPRDPGGRTNRGVTQRVYDAYRRRKGLKPQDVYKIAPAEVQEIYHDGYWSRARGNELPEGVDLAVFDFGVNSGPSRAVRYLQTAVGARADGAFGPLTLAAVREADPEKVVQQICAARLAFVRRLKTWPVFGKGWSRRIADILDNGLEMVESADHDDKPTATEQAIEEAMAELLRLTGAKEIKLIY